MKNTIKLELKRNVVKNSILGFFLFVLVAVIVLQIGVSKYKTGIEQQKDFVEIEKKTTERLINYMQYGTIGFRVILKPSPLVALFHNNTAFGDMVGIIDSGIRLRLNEPKIGPNAFKNPTGGSLDYSWYLLILGSLFVMAWGFFSFRNRGYIRFLMNFTTPKSVYLGVIMGRVLLLAAMIAILGAGVYLQFLINGIRFAGGDIARLLIFLILVLMVMIFLLLVAALLGAIKSKIKGGMVTAFFWLAIVLLWPEMLNVTFATQSAGMIKSTYALEAEKMDKLMDFEREALKETRRYKTKEEKSEADKRNAEYYWNSVYQGIEDLDIKAIEHAAQIARRFHFWSLFNPIILFKSVNNEISSLGFTGFLELYKGNREKKRAFLRYYFDKRFKENYSDVVPFLPPKKTIIAAKSGLPVYFGIGLFLLFSYIALALFLAYFQFMRFIFPAPKKGLELDLTFEVKTGELIHYGNFRTDLSDQFVNVLFGQYKNFPGKIIYNGQPLEISRGKKADIFYIPPIIEIPPMIKAGTIISLIADSHTPDLPFDLDKRFGCLSPEERLKLLFDLPRIIKSSIVVMHEVAKDISFQYEILEAIDRAKEVPHALIDIAVENCFTSRADTCAVILSKKDSKEVLVKYISSRDKN